MPGAERVALVCGFKHRQKAACRSDYRMRLFPIVHRNDECCAVPYVFACTDATQRRILLPGELRPMRGMTCRSLPSNT